MRPHRYDTPMPYWNCLRMSPLQNANGHTKFNSILATFAILSAIPPPAAQRTFSVNIFNLSS